VRRFKPYPLFMLAMTLTGLRLLAFAASTTPAQAILVQLLNGLTFPAVWIAGVAYADANAPAGLSATAQGMFGVMIFGFGAAVGGFFGGPLLESVGGRGLYLVYGCVVLLIVGIGALLERRLPAQTSEALPLETS
jgi:PPP family 3-phenylpropionic acid transporter